MTFQPGHQFGPYKIQALLGIGGMGEVYRARDTRLGREAALKVMAPKLMGDVSLQRRFQLEARAASSLNHPAIVTIYDVGESDGVSWIAMEWVEGRTLRAVLSEGPLSLHDALAIARQIAAGLTAAHAKGVIHRDLKPENIMLSDDGRARILDFGLARQTLVDRLEETGSNMETPVAAAAATFEGAILGTIGYMSPEQASARPVDFRSDQFAFGLILYEMLAGRRAFQRASAVETLAAIIREEPLPLASIRGEIPDRLLQLLARCLAKLPQDRFDSTGELAAPLESIATGVSTGAAPSAATEIMRAPLAPVAPLGSSRRVLYRVVAVVALALALAAAAWIRFPTSPRPIDSLAVLPFRNATGDPNAEYLADGLTESLIDQMSRIPSLKVAARSMVARFKDADPQAAGRQLGFGAVLVGTISRRADQLIIVSELVDISTGSRLWGETYDRPASDLMRVQDSIAWEIADGLRLPLSREEKRSLATHTTQNPEAYVLFLRGRYLLQHDTEEDDLEARRLYLAALEKDPGYADAYLGVASTYARSAGNGYARPGDSWSRADEYARKALALDPGNFGSRVALAIRHFHFDWDWALAEREMRQLSTDPRLFGSGAYQAVAMFYWATGRPDQSIAVVERGLRGDPMNVESRVMRADLLAEAGRLDESVTAYREVMELEPLDPRPLSGLANVMSRRGDTGDAIATLRKAFDLADESAGIEALIGARSEKDYAEAQMAVARERLRRLEALTKERYVSPLDLARLHSALGSREKAFAALDLALAERSPGLTFLKVDRAWDPIRGDARFATIVQRVGIP